MTASSKATSGTAKNDGHHLYPLTRAALIIIAARSFLHALSRIFCAPLRTKITTNGISINDQRVAASISK